MTSGKKKVKFPTGAIAWLNDDGRVEGIPAELFAKLGTRHPDFPHEPSDFECFLEKLISGKLKL